VKLGVGLFGTMAAMLLGLLVASTKGNGERTDDIGQSLTR